ncbi:salivary alpha-glucosidase-like [Mytilus galloprovincialis]|uniref:salivary alpha-glucosidase-like n=1 Tax=Mytilus galloprovincialis TaxID=29158 RepID=UPI003F7C4A4A
MEKTEVAIADEKFHEGEATAGKKSIFCTSNKCSFILLVIIAAAIAASCVIIFTDKELRTKRQYDPSDLEWWKKTIVYQIYPRSFKDSNGDGIGDLKGITSMLDHLTYLGVGAIWISPFYKSPMRDYGYDVQNYVEIDPMFGTTKDFDELMKEAKKKDIKVILDFVPNHTSNDSEWFQKSRQMDTEYKDYYVWSDGKLNTQTRKYEPPNNWLSVFGGSAWTYDVQRSQYYYHAFLETQPDLNYRNPKVLKELKKAMTYWLDKGVSGFRLDAFKFAFEAKNLSLDEALPKVSSNEIAKWSDEQPHNYTNNLPELYPIIKDWRKMLETYKEKDTISRFMSVESTGITQAIRDQYYQAGSVPFNFDLITSLKRTCNGLCFKEIIERGMKDLSEDAWPNFVMGNHDNHRVASRMGLDMIDVMNMLLLTLPGTPTCYYGDEIGMVDVNYTFAESKDPAGLNFGKDFWKYSRDPERSPMQWDNTLNAGFSKGSPWLRVSPDYSSKNVKMQKDSKRNTHIQVFKKVAEIRKLPSFQHAEIQFSVTNKNFLSYVRQAEGRPKYLVIMNVGQDKNAVSADFTKEPVGSSRGQVVAMTGTVDIALNSILNLKEVSLKRGQGLVIRVYH